MPPDLDLRSMRVAALLNTSSGSCDASSRAALLAILEEVGIEPTTVWDVAGHEVDQALDAATQAAVDVLICPPSAPMRQIEGSV